MLWALLLADILRHPWRKIRRRLPERGWGCRWVAALKLLVGMLRAEHRAALSVWPAEYTAAEPAFNEVVSRSVVAATHAGAFIVASKRMPEKVPPGGPLTCCWTPCYSSGFRALCSCPLDMCR